jgi:hypothetical protein
MAYSQPLFTFFFVLSYVGYVPSSDDLGICWCVWRCKSSSKFSFVIEKIGDEYATPMNVYISRFSDGVLFSYSTVYKKMATDVRGGVVDGRARRFQAQILVPGWNPNPDANLFSLIFVYKLTSTNSYNYTNCITNSYNYTNCIVQIHTIIQIV